MATKENKGGFLSNEELEQDLKVRGQGEGPYTGVQDTGDKQVRELGTEVQQRDGAPQEKPQSEEE